MRLINIAQPIQVQGAIHMTSTQGVKAMGARRAWLVIPAALAMFAGTACSLDSLLKGDELPPGVTDPTVTETPAGALAAYQGVIVQFRQAFGKSDSSTSTASNVSFVPITGLFTDELSERFALVSTRTLVEGSQAANIAGTLYSSLQRMRGQARQAIGLLGDYAPEQRALMGHVYALQGYAEMFLAELFCSGVPLSTLDYKGNFTYQAGSTTEQVFTHAAALFDTALAMVGDSARLVQLARIGKARSLLALGEYAAAAAAVAAVPGDYSYIVSYTGASGANARNFAYIVPNSNWIYGVSDHEGLNGLDYRTSGDPRTKTTMYGTVVSGFTIWHPDKYAIDGSSPLVLASGVEARLIEAEAALQAGDPSWLTILNVLRTDGTYDTTETSPPDTLWHAGTGGVAGLRPLVDPGTMDGQVDLLFSERAFWLFLTGHRQGDLRRLIRQYGRDSEQVYPTGTYNSTTLYGTDVTAPIPPEEAAYNPLFTGCLSRGA